MMDEFNKNKNQSQNETTVTHEKTKKEKQICELDTLENLQKKKRELEQRQEDIKAEIKAVNLAIRKVEKINSMSPEQMRDFIIKNYKNKELDD